MQSLKERIMKYLVAKFLPGYHLKRRAKEYKRGPRKKAVVAE